MKTAERKEHRSGLTVARDIRFGECFLYKGALFMRVKPTNFLTNSTLINDVINRGDCFFVDLSTGNVTAYKGDQVVTPVETFCEYVLS